MKHDRFGAAAVVFAAFLWSLDGLLRRELYTLPSMVVVFWEHLFGCLVLLPFTFRYFHKFRSFTKKQWLSITFVAFLSGALGTYFYTAGLMKIQFIPFSVVVLLQQLQPIFAILTAVIFLKEPVTKKFVLLTALALVAAYFVSFPHLHVNFTQDKSTVVAALLALLAAVCWGSSTVFSKYTLHKTSFINTTVLRFALTPVFAFFLVLVLGQGSLLFALNTMQWWYIVAITFSTGLLALGIYYFGLQRIPASRSTLLELTWPVSALFTGYFFLGEHLTITQWLGSIVLIGTMYIVARDARSVTNFIPVEH